MSVISRLRNAATFLVTEGGIDAHIQRVSITDGDGADLTAASAERAPETPVSVSTTAVVIAAALTTRHGVLIYNEGPNDLWVGFSAAVTAANGQRIYAGGSWQLMGIGLYRGANNATLCTVNSQCPGGVCQTRAWCAAGANQGAPCTANSECPGGTCATDTCGGGQLRSCYPDNGVVDTGSVTAVGGHGIPDLANARVSVQMASLFCIGPMSSSSINSTAGLPGLGRLSMAGVMQGLVAASSGQLHGGSVMGGRF